MAILSIKSAGWLHGPGRTVWLGGAIRNFMAWVADGAANTFTVDNLTKITRLTRTDWQGTVAMSANPRTNQGWYSEPLLANLVNKSAGVTDSSAPSPFAGNAIQFPAAKQLDYAEVTCPPSIVDPIVSVFVQMDDGSVPVPSVSNSTGDFCLICNNAILDINAKVTHISGTLYRCSVKRIGSSASKLRFGVWRYATQSGKGFRVVGYQGEPSGGAIAPTGYIYTNGAPVTVTDYALASEEVTLGETPVAGAVFTLDGDITADVEGA